jgi:hypothetical protein
LNELLQAGLIEGLMGRMVFVLGAEKPRIRRQAREIAAMRQLRYAKRNALDRHGADVSVPRFMEDIAFRQTSGADEAFDGEIISTARAEPDDEYRRRLRPYRGFRIPNRRGIAELLNGDGDGNADGGEATPNAGLLGEMGLAERFRILETDNDFGVAIHLIAIADPAMRTNFLSFLKRVQLIYPVSNAANNRLHAARFLPRFRTAQVQSLRERLASAFAFADDGIGLAPMLAEKLDVVGRALAALRIADAPKITRGQDDNGGSRYELGLGADISAFTPEQLRRLADAVAAFHERATPFEDREIDALIRTMRPSPPEEDADGNWFFHPAGMRTVHRLNSELVYLSHFPTMGMAITGASAADAQASVPLEVRYHAEGDPGANAALLRAIDAAAQRWSQAGGAAWRTVDAADAPAVWSRATPPDAATTALVLRAAGLPVVDPAWVREPLAALPAELYQMLILDGDFSSAIINNQGDAVADLSRLVAIFRDAGVSSLLPLIADGRVVLVAAVIGLPQAGINLSQRRASGFRWYVVPIQTQQRNPIFEFKPIGSRTTFSAETTGVYALVSLGYVRIGDTDPYEYRVELPDGAVLALKQYEFLMNVLERAYPVGVQINTFALRHDHVDLNDDGAAEPLTPAASRTYRPFVRKRNRGDTDQAVE